MHTAKNVNLTPREAISVIGSFFRVRRDLVSLVKGRVIDGSGLTLEQSDVLFDIYGATELGWPDPKSIAKGSKWVTLASLQRSVVNNAPELVSRRIIDLNKKNYVEGPIPLTKEEAQELGVSAKSKKVCL